MKKALILFIPLYFFISAAACLSPVSTAGNEPDPDAAIIYTGNINGNLTPNACCGKIGGIAGRATRIEQLKTAYLNTLLIDCGDMVCLDKTTPEKLGRVKIEWLAKSCRILAYDALNIAEGEMLFGTLLAKTYASDPPLPRISANVKINGEKLTPYIIKQVGRARIAVIGIVSQKLFRNRKTAFFSVKDPVESILKILPDIRKESDLIVLIPHAPLEETRNIVRAIPEIDLVLVSHGDYPNFSPLQQGNVPIFKNTVGGATVGLIKIWYDKKENIRIQKSIQTLELLDSKVKPKQAWYSLESAYRMDAQKAVTRSKKITE